MPVILSDSVNKLTQQISRFNTSKLAKTSRETMCQPSNLTGPMRTSSAETTKAQLNIRPVDSVGIEIVVDNSIDILLPSDQRVKATHDLARRLPQA